MNNAIVLVMFGTSVEHALPGLLHIRDRMVARFPQTLVYLAFTSKIIRHIWRDRAASLEYRAVHPEVPEDILNVQSPKVVMARLRKMGIDSLVVQPVHIAPAEEGVRPDSYNEGPGVIETGKFSSASLCKLVRGRPALGTYGTKYPYMEDIVTAVRCLAQDAAKAKLQNAALFYMGHGNRFISTSKVYGEVVVEMRRQYPDILTVMRLVEAGPSIDETVEELKMHKVERVLLKPFMLVAGDHVRKDMVGDEPGTMKTRLENEGFVVFPLVTGLGENTAFADIFVQHAADAVQDAGIELS